MKNLDLGYFPTLNAQNRFKSLNILLTFLFLKACRAK